MNTTKLFFLVLLLLLFMVSNSKILLIPITLVITGFFILKKKYNIALIVLSSLFLISLLYNNTIEQFQSPSTSSTETTLQPSQQPTQTITSPDVRNQPVQSVTMKDYSELYFVLNSLIEPDYVNKNREFLENIIDLYRIDSIYDLSKKALNREKNPQYNNFLEKITCITDNSVDYLMCDNKNYKKMYAFCQGISAND